MKVKEESEKVGLKLNVQKTKIMVSGPITSRQIDGKTVEKAIAPHSSTHDWKIPWTEEPGRLQSVPGVTKSWTRLRDFLFTFHFSCIGEGNGNPLQCSCLENPRDGGAWWAAACGVAQGRTRLSDSAAAAAAGWSQLFFQGASVL